MNGNTSTVVALAVPSVSPAASRMLSNGGIGKRLLTVVEAAGYLGLQVDTVYKKARLRELPSVKVGRALRFDVKALERFVEQHTIETID
jgi:excisionase family DNA binding protein